MNEILSSQKLAIQILWLDFLVDSLSKFDHCIEEFRSELLVINCLQFLQILFFLSWSNKCEAVSILEHRNYFPPNLVLFFNFVRSAPKLLERLLKVAFGSEFVPHLILYL